MTRAFEAFVLEQGVEERSRSGSAGLEPQAWEPVRPAPQLSGPAMEIGNGAGVETGHPEGKDRVLHV